MNEFVQFMGLIIDFCMQEFTIYGYTFSYWQVIILVCLAGLIGVLLRGIFD